MNSFVQTVTQRIVERSKASQQAYFTKINSLATHNVVCFQLRCSTLAHGIDGCCSQSKTNLKKSIKSNIVIILHIMTCFLLTSHMSFMQRTPPSSHNCGAVGETFVLVRKLLKADYSMRMLKLW